MGSFPETYNGPTFLGFFTHSTSTWEATFVVVFAYFALSKVLEESSRTARSLRHLDSDRGRGERNITFKNDVHDSVSFLEDKTHYYIAYPFVCSDWLAGR